MISLNLLDGSAPAYKSRNYGMSKRFLIITSIVTLVLALLIFFLEVLFVAFGLGGGSLLSEKPSATIMVSKDEFADINRQHATAPSVFEVFLQQSPRDVQFTLMKLVDAHRMIAQGYIGSKGSAESMFKVMRESGLWEVQNSQIYDRDSTKKNAYRFQFTARFIPKIESEMNFKSSADFPPSDSVEQVVVQLVSIAQQNGITFTEKPTIQKTIEGTTLFEYEYHLSTESSYSSFHTFLTKVYEMKLPVIFQDITLRPESKKIKADITLRVLTN